MLTAQDVFDRSVRPLAVREQIRLAAIILNAISETDVRPVDFSDSWSAQDERDLTAYSLRYAETVYPEEVQLV